MIKKFIDSLKYIKLKDILAIFIFIFMFIISLFYRVYLRIINKKIILICEDPNEARDNGYHLFKYIRKNYPNDNVYYAINNKASDYNKIKDLGNVINFYSFKHWLYYLSATVNASTHKYGNPNPPVFYFLQVSGLLRNKRVFLQHGITMNNVSFVNYKNSKYKLFVCGAKKEYEFVKNNFGYKDNQVKYLGFPRFDNLDIDNKFNKKQILLMPTWRTYISRTNIDFTQTEYFKKYNSLINNKQLINFLEENDIKLYFYLHRNMQKYVDKFDIKSKNIIVDYNIDIQDLFKESALMITDYSSVSFDFVYMKKPLIYYQFDKNEFRKKHVQEGYFSYERDGFGNVLEDEEDVVSNIIVNYKNDYKLSKRYEKRIEEFFEIRDKDNSKRVYNAIKELL
ncbi:MAG TPA: CDP-glycerol glycerophosphotransferase family protein [Bacilli bacterium]|nr:CDP-glycerol glycerophosphotransferase family protein [Bacilli bacterium]